MCIRDRADIISAVEFDHTGDYLATGDKGGRVVLFERNESCLLYTSDAADERSSVDLGGCRIIKKKNIQTTSTTSNNK